MSDPYGPPQDNGGERQPATPPAACPRHPEQVTYLRCSRCGRPVCTECMVPAAVGFQCRECVSTGARETRRIRTVLGGRPTASTTVTTTLIALSVMAFLFQTSVGLGASATRFGMVPAGIALADQWYRLLTAAFMHGSLIHLAFNMYVLWILGQSLERLLGHSRFLALYVVSALGGSAATYAFSNFHTVSVGASGAVFGLMGAMVVAGRSLRYDTSQILLLIAVNVGIGFLVPGIDWRAHFGGLITGAVVTAVLVRAPRQARALWQWAGIGAVVVLIALVVTWRTTQILDFLGG